MEVIVGSPHVAFPIDDASRIGEARRYGARLADQLQWGETDAGRLALVVTELATNLSRHAQRGRLLMLACAERDEIEVLSIDNGPGIADPTRCLGDGYSTGGTQGTGLGAVRRLAQDFDMQSSISEGTVVLARLRRTGTVQRPTGAVAIGGVGLAAPGEAVSGDGWVAVVDAGRAAVMVVDGLGHGPDGHKAANAALDVFRRRAFVDMRDMLREAHSELRKLRGAAGSVLHLDTVDAMIRSAGVGNVLSRIVSGVSDRSIMSQNGTLGLEIRSLEEVAQPWPAHAIVVMHTDGIETRWSPRLLLPVLGRDPVLAAAILMRDHCRGRDDATVVVLRRST